MSSRDRYPESSTSSSSTRPKSKWDQQPGESRNHSSSSRDSKSDRDRERERVRDRDRGGKSRDSRDKDYDRSYERDTKDRDRDDRDSKSRSYNSNKDHPSSSRRRSRSPDFEADRRRDRQRYDSNSRSQSGKNPSSIEWGGSRNGSGEQAQPQAEDEVDDEPDFGTSGLLAAASNSKNGVALKYHEPPEARLPKKKWRLYVFKNGKEIDLFHISRQSCYLFGRDRSVCDIPVDHPSLSKQHVVLQFRSMTTTNEFGDSKRSTKPYLIDLESSNGTEVNGKEIETSRYFEMKNGDTFKLGASEREYVLLEEGKE